MVNCAPYLHPIRILESSLHWRPKNTKIITTGATGKKLRLLKSKICRKACVKYKTPLLSHLLK